MNYKQKISEGILGLAIGDAIGVPYEFMQPQLFEGHPVTEVIEYGSHNQPLGTWSDDTSMTLALMDALVQHPESPDYQIIMNNFYNWVHNAEFTAGGEVFDVGRTCYESILNFAKGIKPLECGQRGEYDCGNGGLMRILPILFYVYSKYGSNFFENETAVEQINDITSLTHAHPRCVVASVIYISIAGKLLDGLNKDDAVMSGVDRANEYYSRQSNFKEYINDFVEISEPNFKNKSKENMSGKTYVVDTLKASIWAFLGTDNYKDCVFKGINLGNDTDTVAAIAGGLAGIYYGIGGNQGIPLEYLAILKRRDYILDLCEKFAAALTMV